MANTPNVRFEGFTDDWEQRKFEDIAQRVSNTGTSNVDIPSVEYEDVISEQGLLNKDIYQKESIKTGIKFSKEEVLYGKLRPYLHNWLNPDFQGVAVGDWWVLKPIKLDKNFLYRLIQTSQFDDMANQSSGTKMPRADWKLISGTEFCIPTDVKEQEKIGAYFANLDSLITLHQRKYDEVKQLKKFMLQKMFPKSGELVPEIRFAGFTGDWEQHKFGEITELKSASRVHKEEWTTEGVPFYRSSDVMAAINGTENDKAFISQELYEKLSSVSGKLEAGDILVTGGGSVGNPYIVPDNAPLYTKDADLLWIKNQGRFNPYFVYEFFLSPSFKSYLGSISHVGTIAHYTITQLSETPISLPSAEEQDKIGAYFRNLDHLITLHQRKCDELKEVKRYMLQNMFPQKG